MLVEFKDILQMFESVTDELKRSDVSISRVYPCVNYLRKGLKSSGPFNYTKQMRQDFLKVLSYDLKMLKKMTHIYFLHTLIMY